MGERARIEIRTQHAIGDAQQVAVERCRDPKRIVVGRNQARVVAFAVDADQQRAEAAVTGAEQPDRLQQRQRAVRREVADRRAGVEEQRRRVRRFRQQRRQRQRPGQVGDDADRLDARIGLGNAGDRRTQPGIGDVDADVAARRHCGQPFARFRGIAGAEIDPLQAARQFPRDLGAVLPEDRGFGAGRVVFVEVTDRIEQGTALRVVEEFRIGLGLRGQQAGEQARGILGGVDRMQFEQARARCGRTRPRRAGNLVGKLAAHGGCSLFRHGSSLAGFVGAAGRGRAPDNPGLVAPGIGVRRGRRRTS